MEADTSCPATSRPGFLGGIRRSRWFVTGMIACASLVYYLSYYLHFIDMVDEGLFINGGLRLLDGQQPVTEFWGYPPGRYLLLAAAFKTLGIHLTSERFLLIGLLIVRNVLIFQIARRLMPVTAAVAITLTLMLVPGPWHKLFYPVPVLAHLLLLLCYIDKPTVMRAIYCGALTGLVLYLRQDVFIQGVLVAGFAIIAVRMTGSGRATPTEGRTALSRNLRALGHFGVVLLCAILVCVPLFYYYISTADMALLWRRIGMDSIRAVDVVYHKFNLAPIQRLPGMLMGSEGGWMNSKFLNAWFSWTLYLVLGLAVSVGLHTVWRWWRGQQLDTKRSVMHATLLAWSALALSRQINLPSAKTCLIAGQGMMIVAVILLVTAWFWVGRGRGDRTCCRGLVLPDWPRTIRWLLTVPFTAVVFLSWFWLLLLAVIPVPRVPAGSASCLFESNTPMVIPRAELVLPEARANALRNVVEQIQLRTQPGQPIIADQQAMFYFLADRPNATGYDNIVPPMVLPEVAREMTEAVALTNLPALHVIDLSEPWTARVLKRYPPSLRSALFTDFEPTYRFENYLLLEPSPGSDAWELMQPLWIQHKRKRK